MIFVHPPRPLLLGSLRAWFGDALVGSFHPLGRLAPPLLSKDEAVLKLQPKTEN